MTGKRTFTTARTRVGGLDKFLYRHRTESDDMRINVYNTLRKRFNEEGADVERLRCIATDANDKVALAMLNACWLMADACQLLLSASLELQVKK